MPDAASTTSPSLTLERRYAAAPARVFAAWTDPKEIARWWGGADWEILGIESDLRVGGRFRHRSRLPSGELSEVGGTFREVVPGAKLVFTWAWHSTPERESLVTVTLAPDGSGTKLTLTHERFYDETARDNHRRGWTVALDRIAAIV